MQQNLMKSAKVVEQSRQTRDIVKVSEESAIKMFSSVLIRVSESYSLWSCFLCSAVIGIIRSFSCQCLVQKRDFEINMTFSSREI